METSRHLMRRRLARALLLTVAALGSSNAFAGPRMAKVYDPKAPALQPGALMTGGGHPHLSQVQYEQLKYVGTEVLRRFPPNKSYYFGLGRSPACIISMIQNLASDQKAPEKIAMNFPASGIHDGQPHDDASYFRHFDALIPKEVLTGDRAIVLLDRSRPFGGAHSGGESLHIFKQILERYLVARGSSVKVEAVGFSYGALNPSYGLTHIPFDMRTRPELESVSMPHYEAIAEYPQHRIGPNLAVPARRAEYQQYRGFMLERMKRDAELDAFLDKTIASELKAESAEEKNARIASEQEAEAEHAAAQRAKDAERVTAARAFPKTARAEIDQLVAKLPPRAEGHDSGPYLSESAEAMNDWLKGALKTRAEIDKQTPNALKANVVPAMFMEKVEQARVEGKIRNRDYRRLMGHALSAAVMDADMLKSLTTRFAESKHFRREVTEESEHFLTAHAKKPREETANMAANFQLLLQHLPAQAAN